MINKGDYVKGRDCYGIFYGRVVYIEEYGGRKIVHILRDDGREGGGTYILGYGNTFRCFLEGLTLINGRMKIINLKKRFFEENGNKTR